MALFILIRLSLAAALPAGIVMVINAKASLGGLVKFSDQRKLKFSLANALACFMYLFEWKARSRPKNATLNSYLTNF